MALARWQATIVNEAGDVVPGALVTVQHESPGNPPAPCFEDREGDDAIGSTFAADGFGYVGFHVRGGVYKITASLGDFSRVWRYVAIGTTAESDQEDLGPLAVVNLQPLGLTALVSARAIDTSGVSGSPEATNEYVAGDVIDDVTLIEGDVVVRAVEFSGSPAEPGAIENGVYIVQESGPALRHSSFQTMAMLAGALISVVEGTANAGSLWQCRNDRAGSIGSENIVISLFGGGGSLGGFSFEQDLMSVDNGEGIQPILYVPAGFAGSNIFIGDGGADLLHMTALQGYYNIGIGQVCLRDLHEGSYNVMTGFESGMTIYDNNYNTGYGEANQIYNHNGNGNTSIGLKAMLGTAGIGFGDENTAGGFFSMLCGASSEAPAGNTAWGAYTLAGAGFIGDGNVAIGRFAGYTLTDADGNIIIGSGLSALGVTTGDYNTIICGQLAGLSSSLHNNVILGDGQANIRAQCDENGTWTHIAPRGHIAGMITSNNVGTPASKIDIAAGLCRDVADTRDIRFAAGKTIDCGGTGANGLDTGSLGANTIYYTWAISKADGTSAGLASTSASAPTMPGGYTFKRRIGEFVTNGSSQIRSFTQMGDDFLLATPVASGTTSIGTARTAATVLTPPSVLGKFRIGITNAGSAVNVLVQPTFEADAAPTLGASPGGTLRSEVANQGVCVETNVMVDGSQQIAARATAASTAIDILVLGWRSRRGRDD